MVQRVVPRDRCYNCVTILTCIFSYAVTLSTGIIYMGSFSTAFNEYLSLEPSKCKVGASSWRIERGVSK